jgi:molybdopterin-guanine dinucleotide biosynthesis protein MobB
MAGSASADRAGVGGPRLVVGFVGPSNVGKTSLLERLIPALAARGLAVAAVKHSSHGFAADRPGKDSHRLYTAGAAAVALISREQLATFTRREESAGEDVSLDAALGGLPGGLDVVLAEGFSWEPIPRVVLRTDADEPPRAHVESGEVLEVVTLPGARDGGRPDLPDALIDSLAQTLAARVARPDRVAASGAPPLATRPIDAGRPSSR